MLLSLALGVDCLVVSFSQGLIFNSNKFKNSIVLAFTMGFFQGAMPVLGCGGAVVVNDYLEAFSSFVVFGIFFILGIKFIYEACKGDEDELKIACIGFKCLVSMGIATSIDALGAGVSLHFSGVNMYLAVFLIGLFSFVMSLIGFWSGSFFKHIPSKYLEIASGVVLIGLAFKALI